MIGTSGQIGTNVPERPRDIGGTKRDIWAVTPFRGLPPCPVSRVPQFSEHDFRGRNVPLPEAWGDVGPFTAAQ